MVLEPWAAGRYAAPRQSVTCSRLLPALKPRKGLEALSSMLSRPCRRSGIIGRACGAMRRTPFHSPAIWANVVHVGFFAHPSEQGGNSQHRCSHPSNDEGRESHQDGEQQTEDSQRDAEGQDAAEDAHALTVSPYVRVVGARIESTRGATMRERSGSIRTAIPEQGGSPAVTAGARQAERGSAGSWCFRSDAGALAEQRTLSRRVSASGQRRHALTRC